MFLPFEKLNAIANQCIFKSCIATGGDGLHLQLQPFVDQDKEYFT